jgi:hypothetical protein
MLVVTVELWPGGDESRKRHLGTAKIVNDGTGTTRVGNYTATLSKWGRPNQVWKRGSFRGFRRQAYGAWDLLGGALVGLLSDRIQKAFSEVE